MIEYLGHDVCRLLSNGSAENLNLYLYVVQTNMVNAIDSSGASVGWVSLCSFNDFTCFKCSYSKVGFKES